MDIWTSAAEFEAWIEEYNAAGIDPDFPPPERVIEEVKSCSFTFCSDLRRSIDSAAVLGIERVGVSESIFRELDMPCATWRYPRLPVFTWAVLFRLMWVMGYSAKVESLREARNRATLCATRLAEMADEHGKLVFVGHGALLWFVSRRLKDAGWSGPKKSPRGYWDFGVYSYEEK
jgi:broad specificity phosphatase PhoE